MKPILAVFLALAFAFPSFAAGAPKPLSRSDKDLWIRCIKTVRMRPPCCGACGLFGDRDAKRVWEYLTSPDPKTKTGEDLQAWQTHRKKLLAEFKNMSPARYAALYGADDLQEKPKKGDLKP